MSRPLVADTLGAERELSLSSAMLADLLQSVLARQRSFRFRAKGTSMYPFVKDGDVLVVSPLRQGEPRLGDVVACVLPETGRLLVHRILQKQKDICFIKGDNPSSDSGWFHGENILGRVVRVERNGKRVLFGLGIERLLIVLLARLGWLGPIVNYRVWRFVVPLTKKMSARANQK